MTFQELYDELVKFVHYLAHQKANGALLMDHDEISGELFEELVKGYARYGHLPKGELIAVIKRMLDNRIGELTYKYYKTHRRLGNGSITIPEDDSDTVDSICDWTNSVVWSSNETCQNVSKLVESRERVQETYDRLSNRAKTVLDALLEGDGALDTQLYFAGLRASNVYKGNGKVKVRSWQLADSLGMCESSVRKAITEIRKVYAEVSNVV